VTTPAHDPALEARAINTIRGLAMDAVQAANSGHPGTPMALAPLAHVLFTRLLRYDAGDPDWPDRDRFILSAGHASMLLYASLFLTGVGDLTLDDLRDFRQFGSKTPGHPEARHTKGVEVTTGPLGQGIADSVGMAMAERFLRSRFGPEVANHHVVAICSDGDLEEGVSHEAASLAGHQGLDHLVWIYDDNHITIDGPTELSYSDDVPTRFRAYGWRVIELGEVANDLDALERGVRDAMQPDGRPTIVVLRSHIGWPSPKYTDTAKAHGSPLGEDEVRAVKTILGLDPDEAFAVPADVLEYYRAAGRRGGEQRARWENTVTEWKAAHRDLADELDACVAGRGLVGWETKLPTWSPGDGLATRQAMGQIVNAIADVVPGLVGGGADLTENTGTELKDHGIMAADVPAGRLVHFGIREHAMGGALVGMAMHGGVLPFGGTFFVFSDYMKPSVRLAALAQAKALFVWTHDSVGLGEDGPTHQPVEHLAALRAVPGLTLFRPADANEVAAAVRIHVDGNGPTGLVLSRQKLPVLDGTAERAADGVAQGAYVLVDEHGSLDLVLIGTGSEVSLCVEAARVLDGEGVGTRVVSMPSWDRFAAQSDAARGAVLPATVPTLAVEAGASLGWARWADDVVALDRFGESAPGNVALERLGFNVDNVVERARRLLAAPPTQGRSR